MVYKKEKEFFFQNVNLQFLEEKKIIYVLLIYYKDLQFLYQS